MWTYRIPSSPLVLRGHPRATVIGTWQLTFCTLEATCGFMEDRMHEKRAAMDTRRRWFIVLAVALLREPFEAS